MRRYEAGTFDPIPGLHIASARNKQARTQASVKASIDLHRTANPMESKIERKKPTDQIKAMKQALKPTMKWKLSPVFVDKVVDTTATHHVTCGTRSDWANNRQIMKHITLLGLKQIPFFSNLPVAALDALADKAKPVKFEKGDTIISEGEQTHSLYIVVTGKVKILTNYGEDKNVDLVILEPGHYFGEMALGIRI